MKRFDAVEYCAQTWESLRSLPSVQPIKTLDYSADTFANNQPLFVPDTPIVDFASVEGTEQYMMRFHQPPEAVIRLGTTSLLGVHLRGERTPMITHLHPKTPSKIEYRVGPEYSLVVGQREAIMATDTYDPEIAPSHLQIVQLGHWALRSMQSTSAIKVLLAKENCSVDDPLKQAAEFLQSKQVLPIQYRDLRRHVGRHSPVQPVAA